jgi:outer membrane scaffolding protein for murein synthesis (MipA/OmpV family)
MPAGAGEVRGWLGGALPSPQPTTRTMTRNISPNARNGVALALALAGAQAWAADAQALAEPALPRWEVGLAAGVARVPDYPGAARASTRGIVLPVLIYRGPVLRVDDGGIRGRVFNSADWSLDLSATGAFNAKADGLRQGMPALDYLFGIGPQAVYKGWLQQGAGPSLHLKLRALMSTDLQRIDARGFSLDPELRWRLPAIAGTPATLTLSLQPTWASRPLHRYFYEVPATAATATRPAFDARPGYLGTGIGATLSDRPARNLSWFVSARVMSLHGAANTASPLLRERSNLSLGAGVVWTPWRSRDSAAD